MDTKIFSLAIACIALIAGCSDLPQPAPTSAKPPAAAPPAEPTAAEPPSEAGQPPTPLADLKAFARDCDKLLAEIDHAHRTNRLAVSTARDNGASWGRFASSFRTRTGKLRDRGKEFAPLQARVAVGSVAGYLDTLFQELLSSDPVKYTEFRQFVGKLIEERDTYLAGIDEPTEPEIREFTDSTGQFRVTATFISADGTTATLQKADGTEVKVPIARLSEGDQEWIAQQPQ